MVMDNFACCYTCILKKLLAKCHRSDSELFFLNNKPITIDDCPCWKSVFVRLCQNYCTIKTLIKTQNLKHDRFGYEVHFQVEFEVTFVFLF